MRTGAGNRPEAAQRHTVDLLTSYRTARFSAERYCILLPCETYRGGMQSNLKMAGYFPPTLRLGGASLSRFFQGLSERIKLSLRGGAEFPLASIGVALLKSIKPI